MNNLSIDELLNKAFSLACFILGSREDALRTVEESMARLNVTTAAQDKRLYYKSSAQTWMGDRYRNKVLFSELHLLQRLVYISSEPYEQKQEEASGKNSINEEAMLIHFIKHLVRITTRRNSFYVTLGLSRLLYNYTTAETMEVYNAVIQDPERVKDDYYYRSRKGVLMQELKERFGSLIEVARGPRGEERFRASSEQGRLTELVDECLSFFTPWYTPCLVPAGVNPIMDGITSLSSRGQKEEDKVEVDRIHAVLHPNCHERLIDALGFDSPTRRLEVPHFFLSKNNGNGEGTRGGGCDGERRQTPGLDQRELAEIKGHLDEQSVRRKRAFAGLLRVLVDGHEHARLDLSRSSRARFALGEDAGELLEVRTTVNGDDLLLATHFLTHNGPESREKSAPASIVLEGGQKLTITVAPTVDEEGAMVDVAYRETHMFKAASLYLRQLVSSNGNAGGSRSLTNTRVPALALGFALLMLSAFGVVQFLRNRTSSPSISETVTSNRPDEKPAETIPRPVETGPAETAKNPPAPSAPADKGVPKRVRPENRIAAPAPASPEAVEADNAPRRRLEQPERKEALAVRQTEPSAPRRTIQPERDPSDSERTRTTEGAIVGLPLSGVKKIYVELSGDGALYERVRAKLIERLSASNRFTTTESKDEADAQLRVNVTGVAGEPEKVNLSARLVNARGKTLWPSAGAGGVETGSIEFVAGGVIKGLLDESRKSEGRR